MFYQIIKPPYEPWVGVPPISPLIKEGGCSKLSTSTMHLKDPVDSFGCRHFGTLVGYRLDCGCYMLCLKFIFSWFFSTFLLDVCCIVVYLSWQLTAITKWAITIFFYYKLCFVCSEALRVYFGVYICWYLWLYKWFQYNDIN